MATKVLFFFFRGKVYALTHSLESEKVFFFPRSGKKKTAEFWLILAFLSVFFLPPRKSLQATHSLNLEGCFFPASEKKTPFLLTHSNMRKIFQKTNFSREKKNSTFGTIFCFRQMNRVEHQKLNQKSCSARRPA